MSLTQENLYDNFLEETKALREQLEAKVKALNESLAEFKAPHDRQFAIDTSPVKESLLPEINEIEQQHKYECHKVAVKAHRAIDKLERKRQAKLDPIQKRWNDMTTEHQIKYDEAVKARTEEVNAEIEALTAEFNEANKPAHEAYLARAKALEMQELGVTDGTPDTV